MNHEPSYLDYATPRPRRRIRHLTDAVWLLVGLALGALVVMFALGLVLSSVHE
jgi:hypothetical protein